MSSPADFFDERREWSRWKHEILRRYLPNFAGILGSVHPLIYYVDCFAGAGTYSADPPVLGSPLIAAALAATLSSSEKWHHELRCTNVEPSQSNFRQLSQATAAHQANVINLQGTFRERVDDVLKAVADYPNTVLP